MGRLFLEMSGNRAQLFKKCLIQLRNFFEKVRYCRSAFFKKSDAAIRLFLKRPVIRIGQSDVRGGSLRPNFSGKVRNRKRTFLKKSDTVDQLFFKSPVTVPEIF
jgi:hypothetical protein